MLFSFVSDVWLQGAIDLSTAPAADVKHTELLLESEGDDVDHAEVGCA